jgi:RNA polymerase sigma-70 factor (ECF subfamily)
VQPETAHISINDETLTEQWQSGDSAALERLIIKYKDRIYNAILRICNNRDTAAELCQDVFIKVIENAERFQGKSSFYTWAFRIAVNVALNYCRRQNVRKAVSLEAGTGGDYEQAKAALRNYLTDEGASDPAAVAQSKEQIELLAEAINELDEDQRAVLVLRDIEGMNYTQIAKVIEIELGTVKSRLSRARANLREKLEVILK